MAFLLPAFVAFDTARACVAFGVIQSGIYLPPAKIAFLSELCKLACALVFHFRWHRAQQHSAASPRPSWFSRLLPTSTIDACVDYRICVYTSVPAALYLINNVLYLVGLRFLSPALLNTAMLLKLPLTAVLHYLIMKRARCTSAWVSLALLSLGVLSLHFPWNLVNQLLSPDMAYEPEHTVQQTWLSALGPLLGFIIAAISSVTAISTEVLLKKPMPFWTLQIWLYSWGATFAALLVVAGVDQSPNEALTASGSLNANVGYAAVVFTTCATGLVVANILRKADNLVKLVGSGATIVTTLLLQPFLEPSLWSQTCSPTTILAVGLIALSTWTYNYYKDLPAASDTAAIQLPMRSPQEKMAGFSIELGTPLMSEEGCRTSYTDKADASDDSERVHFAYLERKTDALTPTRSKLLVSAVIICIIAFLAHSFIPSSTAPAAAYDPLHGVQLASWSQKANGTRCLEDWRKEENMTPTSYKFSEWDYHFTHQTMCPIYPVPSTGYMFHMLWLGPLSDNMVTIVSMTIDAWLATQRLQNGHQLIFWYSEDPVNLRTRYTKYAQHVDFRFFDREAEAAGTCLATMPEYNDEAYQRSHNMPPQTISDLIRILLLAKFGGIWLDTDSIPLRDFTPLMRMGPFCPLIDWWNWNNNVLFFGPPSSGVAQNVLSAACSMPYDEALFSAQHPDIKPHEFYWLYNDGVMKVCEKLGCGVQRLSDQFFDGSWQGWNDAAQPPIQPQETTADGHSLAPGNAVPVAFRESWVWHARHGQQAQAISHTDNAMSALRRRVDELLLMGPSMTGRDLFAGPALISRKRHARYVH